MKKMRHNNPNKTPHFYTHITPTLDPGMYATILYGFNPGEREHFANPATCNFWLTPFPAHKYNEETLNCSLNNIHSTFDTITTV